MKPEGAVGRSIPRIDAVEKVTGRPFLQQIWIFPECFTPRFCEALIPTRALYP